jgi:ERCC4-type nuclease
MIIKVDSREQDLLQKIQQFIASIPIFKQIQLETHALPIGDIIICDNNQEEKVIIERKSVNDLLASIKDGRYEEQSYRLNGLIQHNHNIIYLIEGDIAHVNRFKSDNKIEKLTLYSAIFSLNYYKGFSVLRSFSLEESATIICNMAYKLGKEITSGKKAFYNNFIFNKHIENIENIINNENIEKNDSEKNDSEKNDNENKDTEKNDTENKNNLEEDKPNEKDYVSVIKKVKKENITPDNIGEIMLCQIPGVSSVTALIIMEQYHSLSNLIKELEKNENCLKDLSSTNSKGQTRKINKTSIANIVKFLLKK